MQDKILTINVKPGWKEGTRITFPNEGDQVRKRTPKKKKGRKKERKKEEERRRKKGEEADADEEETLNVNVLHYSIIVSK